MAEQQLNRVDEARADLAQAGEIIQKEMPRDDLTGWREWLMARALMHEATALIQVASPTPEAE
jgi:hypothetical protein